MADFSTVRQDKCRETKLPEGCALGDSRTVVLQSVLNEIKEHGRSSMHKEVCGVLVGSLCWDGGPYLLVDGRIEGKHASHQSGSVTFTSETWDYIHEELAAKYPERIIVGWYHTHPGFGVFLSNMDAFIHENFFSFPWEPAYVFDPQAETDGFFFRVGTELVKEEVCVSLDVAPSVKEPLIRNDIPEKIIVENTDRRRYVLPMIAVALVVSCLSAVIVIFAMKQLRAKEESAKTTEKKPESPCGALAGKDTEIKRQIQRRQWEENGWIICEETYNEEIDGRQIKRRTITREKRPSSKGKQIAVDGLKSNRLEKAIRECESQISNKTIEVNRAKADLDLLHKQLRQLEQHGINGQEKPAAKADMECPWYLRLKSWIKK